MLQSITVVLLFSTGLTLRAVSLARLQTWWAFSKATALICVASLAAEFAAVSTLALVVIEQSLPTADAPDLQTSLGAVALAHASARRARTSERAGTLLFGLTAWTLDGADRYVVTRIERKFIAKTDAQLLSLSDHLTARLGSGTTADQLRQLASVRGQKSAAMTSTDPHLRAVARAQLHSEVSRGWMEYTMGRPS